MLLRSSVHTGFVFTMYTNQQVHAHGMHACMLVFGFLQAAGLLCPGLFQQSFVVFLLPAVVLQWHSGATSGAFMVSDTRELYRRCAHQRFHVLMSTPRRIGTVLCCLQQPGSRVAADRVLQEYAQAQHCMYLVTASSGCVICSCAHQTVRTCWLVPS